MTGFKILYKFPTRERPDKFFAGVNNIHTFSEGKNYKIFATCDLDDETMNNREVVDKIKSYKKIKSVWDYSHSKVNAVNRDMEFSGKWDIVIVMSDDMVFIKQGFDNIIREDMKEYFPDLDGVLHYPDGSPAHDKLITMSIMGRRFYERFNYLYYPEYRNVYCDSEFTDVARLLGKIKFINNNLFIHAHPIWGKGEMDTLYKRNEEPVSYEKDHQLYARRKKINFGL